MQGSTTFFNECWVHYIKNGDNKISLWKSLYIEAESQTCFGSSWLNCLPSLWLLERTRWAPSWRSCQWGWAAELQPSGPDKYSHGPTLAPVFLSGKQPESIKWLKITLQPCSCLQPFSRKSQSSPMRAYLLLACMGNNISSTLKEETLGIHL